MSILPKGIYRFKQYLPKFQWDFNRNRKISKIYMEPQRTPNSQNNLEKNKTTEVLEYTCLQRYTKDRLAHEKILNIIKH